MKRNLLIVALMCIAFTSCTKKEAISTTATLITSNLSAAIVNGLECAKPEVVTADIKAKIDEAFKIQAQGNIVAATFCKTVVDIVIPQVVGASLPVTWECKATMATTAVTDLLKTKACDKL